LYGYGLQFMKDVLEEGGLQLRPLSILALLAIAILSFAILYNAFLGQVDGAGRPRFVASQETAGGASTRVDVIASNSRNATIVLKYDPRVEEVQRALLATGNYRGMVDGVAGKNTRMAIATYQKSAGLRVNGEVSNELIEHLRYTQQVAAASEFTASVAKLEKKPGEAAALRQVQTGLAELGYAPGEITGDLTSATIQAIIQFEKDRGLPRKGAVTSALLEEISKMSGDSAISAE
jgi:peptidoglycan hydrolase-like protein with peptidoglycan-binding domain